jgi:CRP-like cAMP-binding protein
MSGALFERLLVERALEDQPIASLDQLREWFNDFVELHEDNLSELVSERARNDPRAGASRGRKKSAVFSLLQGGGGSGAVLSVPQRGSSSSGLSPNRSTSGRRPVHRGSGSLRRESAGESAGAGFAALANRRKSRAPDVNSFSQRAASLPKSGSGAALSGSVRVVVGNDDDDDKGRGGYQSFGPAFGIDVESAAQTPASPPHHQHPPSKSSSSRRVRAAKITIDEEHPPPDQTPPSELNRSHLASPFATTPATSSQLGSVVSPAHAALHESVPAVRVNHDSSRSRDGHTTAAEDSFADAPHEQAQAERPFDDDDDGGGGGAVASLQASAALDRSDRRSEGTHSHAGELSESQRSEMKAMDPEILTSYAAFADRGSPQHPHNSATPSGKPPHPSATISPAMPGAMRPKHHSWDLSSRSAGSEREESEAPLSSEQHTDVLSASAVADPAQHGSITFVYSGFTESPSSMASPRRRRAGGDIAEVEGGETEEERVPIDVAAPKAIKRSASPVNTTMLSVDVLGEHDDSGPGHARSPSARSPMGVTAAKRLVSFGVTSVASASNDNGDDEDPSRPKKQMSMGVRLLNNLSKKQSTVKAAPSQAGPNADREFSAFGAGAWSLRNSDDDDNDDDADADANGDGDGFGGAADGNPLIGALVKRPSRTVDDDADGKGSSGDKDKPALQHIESTLEVKALLTQDRYFTQEQLRVRAFHRISTLFGYFLADFSIALIFFTAFTIAARVGLGSHKMQPGLAYAELAIDVVNFVLVLGVNLFLPFEDQGHVTTDIRAIVRRYISNPRLAVFDVVSTFPVLVIATAIGSPQAEWARLNLLLRELRLPKLVEKLEEQLPATLHPSVMRLLAYLMYLLLIVTHITALVLFVIRFEDEAAVEEWLSISKTHQYEPDPFFWFSRIWREILGLVADKTWPYPHTDLQFAVSLVAVAFSLGTLAVILASFEEMIVTEIEDGSILAKKIDDALIVMDEMKVPSALKQEVVEYYRSMWDINRSFDYNTDDVLAELPDMLHGDIEFESNARVIRAIPLFAEVAQNPDFVRLLAGELQQLVVMPGAPIVQKGEDGDCMFFVSSGLCSIMDDDGKDEVAVLGGGSFFGEVTLLFGGQRDRTINAKTLCVLYVVTDAQFEKIVDVYPEALDGILKSAVQQMKQSQTAIDDGIAEKIGELALDSTESPKHLGGADKGDGDEEEEEDGEIMSDAEIRQMMAARMKFGARRARGGSRVAEHDAVEYTPRLGELSPNQNTLSVAGARSSSARVDIGSEAENLLSEGDDDDDDDDGGGPFAGRRRSQVTFAGGGLQFVVPAGRAGSNAASPSASQRRGSHSGHARRRQSVGFALTEAFHA